MFLVMDVNTEKMSLIGMKHVIKNAAIKVVSIYYDLKNGVNLNIGIFSCKTAERPVLNLYYNIELSDESYQEYFSENSLKKTDLLESCYKFIKSLPEFNKAKIINDKICIKNKIK